MKPQRGVVTDGIYRNEFFKIAIPVKEEGILDDRANYDQLKTGGMPVTEAGPELADGILTFEEMEKVFMGRNRDFAMYNAEYNISIVVQFDNMNMLYGCIKTVDEYMICVAYASHEDNYNYTGRDEFEISAL